MLHEYLLLERTHAPNAGSHKGTNTFRVVRQVACLGQCLGSSDQGELCMSIESTGFLRLEIGGEVEFWDVARSFVGRGSEQTIKECFAAQARRSDCGCARDNHTAL